MILLILYIITMAWIANLISWKLDIPLWLKFKKQYLNYKIINCATCSGFWISIPINVILFTNPYLWFFLPFTISVVSTYFENKFNMFI